LGIDSCFFLNTSSYWWGRKNLVSLIQAFARVKRKLSLPHQLVITGKPGPSLMEMKEMAHQEAVAADVKFLSYVEREEIAALMQSAEALVFPSLHEGFGLPILEAMASGCPVVTSNRSAMKEVAGDSAVLVDPACVDAIVEGMEKVVTNTALREQLIKGGTQRTQLFTWDLTAKKTLDVFSEFIPGKSM
jgi:glycosyltransferase involved in cell wall biosynthesis